MSNVLNKKQQEMCDSNKKDYSDLRALFLNCTLKLFARNVAY